MTDSMPAGFDPDRWFVQITCTNRGSHQDQHGKVRPERLGWLYETEDALMWSPRTAQLEDGSARVYGGPTRLDEDKQSAVRAQGHEGQVRYGRGSINFSCPEGCTWRFSREQWGQLCAATRAANPDSLDLSKYA